MSNKILVLGATGNVGSSLVQMLKKHGADFRVAIKSDSESLLSTEGIKYVSLDYNDVSSLETAMVDIDSLFVLIPDSPQMCSHATNIKDAILKTNVFRYIYLSGLGVKLAPDTWLSQNLLECEKILEASGASRVILRPTFFMQNFINHYPPDSANQMSLPIGDGEINYIDVDDVAYAAFTLLTDEAKANGKEVFHLTGKDAMGMNQVTKIFTEVLKRTYTYSPISLEEAKQAMKSKDLPDWLINMLSQIYQKVVENKYAHTTQEFKLLTGKEPGDLKAFIANNQAHFNQLTHKN